MAPSLFDLWPVATALTGIWGELIGSAQSLAKNKIRTNCNAHKSRFLFLPMVYNLKVLFLFVIFSFLKKKNFLAYLTGFSEWLVPDIVVLHGVCMMTLVHDVRMSFWCFAVKTDVIFHQTLRHQRRWETNIQATGVTFSSLRRACKKKNP